MVKEFKINVNKNECIYSLPLSDSDIYNKTKCSKYEHQDLKKFTNKAVMESSKSIKKINPIQNYDYNNPKQLSPN